MSFSYEIKDFDAGGRIGKCKVNGKTLTTPNLFPVVNPFENLVPPKRLFDHFGAQSIFTNAYILYKSREKHPEILEKGLHAHLDFPGVIATDSGGFQDYMYAGPIKIQPDEIEPFQEQIGSDCPVILDIPVQTTDSFEIAQNKVEVTIQRAQENIARRTRPECAWFGPIHGSIYPELLKQSTLEMSKLDFGIYAIGGVVKTFIDYRFDLDVSILLEVKKWLRPDRPLHMFGLGLPAFFPLAVACGADTFDSAAYILYAKDNRYFTLTGTKNLNDLTELPCHCPICTSYTAQELKKANKNEKIKALAEHNLYHSYSELRQIRNAIKEGTLWDLVEHRVHGHPKFIQALRKVRDNPKYFQEMLNMNHTKGQMILSEFSFYRPAFQYFREKLRQYEFPPNRPNILFLPELDLPTYHSAVVRDWILKLKKRPSYEETMIFLVSNTLGAIPLDLADIYPASQHEGTADPQNHATIRKHLLELFREMITKNWKACESISILIPQQFSDEYGQNRDFSPKSHIISQYAALLQKEFPDLPVELIDEIEE